MARPALIDKLMQPAKWLFRKELIPLDDIINPDGGLIANAAGLTVDFASMPPAQLRQMIMAMILDNGGLAVDTNGKLYVDFTKMGTDRFDAMIENFRKSLKLPKWLTSAQTFYVDKSHASAGNSLIEGRGLSASLPFQSLQVAANFIANNYNVANFAAIIDVGPGDYTEQGEQLDLGTYTNTTGSITIRGRGPTSTYLPRVNCRSTAAWSLENLCVRPVMEDIAGSYLWAIGSNNEDSNIGNLRNVTIDLSNMVAWTKSYYPILVYGILQIKADSLGTPNGVSIRSGGTHFSSFMHTSGGVINCFADINILDNLNYSQFASSAGMGRIGFQKATGGQTNPGRMPQINTNGKTCAGKRYSCATGGVINVNGAGPDFFPGNEDGTVDAATYSWYK